MTQPIQGLETTIGLEIHVELNTRTKLFCSCSSTFGAIPNSFVCPICLGHPGVLPVFNKTAIEYAVMIGNALSCHLAKRSIFHRKNYFYPDQPKNYQISQYDIPINGSGHLEIVVEGEQRRIGITRAHLEEDTGKSVHIGGGGRIHEAQYSLEDFNRAGVPLIEIVTEPDIRSSLEARVFAEELRSILEYLGVSDVRMEEGSMRIDANISVAPTGGRGTKVEVKNMNSMRSLQRALAFEEQRQTELIASEQVFEAQTRHWDEKAGVTKPLRAKEQAFDYRYFPEPDLPPLVLSDEWLADILFNLPELPASRRARYMRDLRLSAYDAGVLTGSKALGDYFEAVLAHAGSLDPKRAANWLTSDLLGALGNAGLHIGDSPVSAQSLAELGVLVADGKITVRQGKDLLPEMVATGRPPSEIVAERGLRQIGDRDELLGVVDQVIQDNREAADRALKGEGKAISFLVGQVMKATRGQANPQMLLQLINERLGSGQ